MQRQWLFLLTTKHRTCLTRPWFVYLSPPAPSLSLCRPKSISLPPQSLPHMRRRIALSYPFCHAGRRCGMAKPAEPAAGSRSSTLRPPVYQLRGCTLLLQLGRSHEEGCLVCPITVVTHLNIRSVRATTLVAHLNIQPACATTQDIYASEIE